MYAIYSEFNEFSDEYIDRLVEDAPDQILFEISKYLTSDVYLDNTARYDEWVVKIMERANDDLYEDDFSDSALSILYLLYKTSGFRSSKCAEHLKNITNLESIILLSQDENEQLILISNSNIGAVIRDRAYELLSTSNQLKLFPLLVNTLLNPEFKFDIHVVPSFVLYFKSLAKSNKLDSTLDLSVICCLSSILDEPNVFSTQTFQFPLICNHIEEIGHIIFGDRFQALYKNAQMLGALQNPEYWSSVNFIQPPLEDMPTF